MLLDKGYFHIYMPGLGMNPDPDRHTLAAFIIDGLVVEPGIYSKQFFEMFNNSIIREESEDPDTGNITVSLEYKNDGEKQYMILPERLASIMLSSPLLVEVPEDKKWIVIGSKYIDGEFQP